MAVVFADEGMLSVLSTEYRVLVFAAHCSLPTVHCLCGSIRYALLR